MYQTQSSWCINKAANLANLVEICIAADTANVGGEGELGVDGESEILALFDRRESRVANKWEGGNEMGAELGHTLPEMPREGGTSRAKQELSCYASREPMNANFKEHICVEGSNVYC